MRKKLKYLLIFFFGIIILTFPESFADLQDSIEYITMDVNLSKNGDAEIMEKWITTAISIPTYCKIVPNISKEQIQNISLQETTRNVVYQYEQNWNSLTEEERIHKFFITEEENGVAIYWTGEIAGFQEYEVKYTIKSFVQQFKDKQGFCFDFLTNSITPTPYGIEIRIHAPFAFSKENISLSQYGFDGRVDIKNGAIEITDIQAFKTIKLLGELKSNVFTIQEEKNSSLKELKEQLKQEYPTIIKKEDKFVIGILLIVSLLYVLLESYSIFHAKTEYK